MLEIVRYNEDEYDFPCLLVLGCFDGLHIGHAELLKKAKLQAKINGLDLGVMLFADGKGGKNLYTFEERVAFLEKYNVKFVLKIDFNDEFKSIKPLDFLACLEDKLNVKAYMSGKDFRFGNGKKGKSATLKTYAEDEENGVWYMPVKDVVFDGEKVSTTSIKGLLENGNVKKAAELLGRNYAVTGTVIKGADRGGKTLGFPTVNIEYPSGRFEVKQGVYKVLCRVDGAEYVGIANFGSRPTFAEDNVLLEAYLKDFEGSLYEKEVTVEFVDYIRDIIKFDGADALAVQLNRDLAALDGECELAVSDAEEPVSVEHPSTEPVQEETTEQAEKAEEQPVAEVVPVEGTASEEQVMADEQIERENEDFEEELNETVVVEKREINEVKDAHRPTKEEKLLENTEEVVPVEPVEEEHSEAAAEIEGVDEQHEEVEPVVEEIAVIAEEKSEDTVEPELIIAEEVKDGETIEKNPEESEVKGD